MLTSRDEIERVTSIAINEARAERDAAHASNTVLLDALYVAEEMLVNVISWNGDPEDFDGGFAEITRVLDVHDKDRVQAVATPRFDFGATLNAFRSQRPEPNAW
jgi:hypothetical protein